MKYQCVTNVTDRLTELQMLKTDLDWVMKSEEKFYYQNLNFAKKE